MGLRRVGALTCSVSSITTNPALSSGTPLPFLRFTEPALYRRAISGEFVAEPKDEVVRLEDQALDRRDVRQAVDPPDEFDVVRAPRRIGADCAHVFLDRLDRRRVSPAERQVDDARRDREVLEVA